MAAKDDKIQFNILSVSRSVLVVGGFYAFLTTFLAIVLLVNLEAQIEWALFLSALLTLVVAAFWIVMGIKIRHSAKQPKKALKLIAVVMYTSIVFLAVNIFETFLEGVGTGLIIMAVFTVYMVWSYMDIRDRVKGKK